MLEDVVGACEIVPSTSRRDIADAALSIDRATSRYSCPPDRTSTGSPGVGSESKPTGDQSDGLDMPHLPLVRHVSNCRANSRCESAGQANNVRVDQRGRLSLAEADHRPVTAHVDDGVRSGAR